MAEIEDFALRAVHGWAATLPELDATADELAVFIRLSRVAALQDRLDDRSLRPFEAAGVRGSDDFRTLALLRRTPGGLTNSDLIAELGGSKAGMSARLSRLEAGGLTQRAPSAVDRRSHTNTLTDRGVDVTNDMVETVVQARKLLLSSLSNTQVGELSAMLADILTAGRRHE